MKFTKHNTYTVNKFTEESAKELNRFVLDFCNEPKHTKNTPMVLMIDSLGGSLHSLFSMLESLNLISNPIVTVCTGRAASCGAALLAAGDHRFCGKHSSIILHQGSGGVSAPVEFIQNDVNYLLEMNERVLRFLASRCKMTHREFKGKMESLVSREGAPGREWYLTPQEAVDLGLVHHIGTPKIKRVSHYTIDVSEQKF